MANSTGLDLNLIPAGQPPAGVTPNLINPPEMWSTLLPTVIISLSTTIFFVSIRIFTKLRLLRKLAYEDYVLVAAEISLIVWCTLLLVQPTHGADIWNTSLADYVKFAFWSNLIIVLYVPGVLSAKWAILLQLQRVFTVQTKDATWWTVRVLIWLSSLFYFIVGFIDVFQCTPREKIWNPETPGHCFDINAVLIGTSVFNVLMNCTILVLPLVVLHGVQMQPQKKLVVSLIFSVTGLAAISSVMRTIYSVLFMRSTNPTRDIFPVAYWAIAEIACVILATTFPTMPRFIEYVRSGFDLRVGMRSSPYGLDKKKEPSSGNAKKSWFQLTVMEDEEKEVDYQMEMRIVAAPGPSSHKESEPSTRSPSRAAVEGLGGITKTVEVEVTSVV